MSKKREERKRKQKGRRIIAERRKALGGKKNTAKNRERIPQSKTVFLSFALFLILAIALLAFLLLQERRDSGIQPQVASTTPSKSAKALPGLFWLRPEGERVESEALGKNEKKIIIYAYLDKSPSKDDQEKPFRYLLRNENITTSNQETKTLLTRESLKPWKGEGFLFYPSKRKRWQQFYILNEKAGIVAFLLNNSGRYNKGEARQLFSRLQIID